MNYFQGQTQTLNDPNSFFNFAKVTDDKIEVHVCRRKDRYQDYIEIFTNYLFSLEETKPLNALPEPQIKEWEQRLIDALIAKQMEPHFLGPPKAIQLQKLLPIDSQLTKLKLLDAMSSIHRDAWVVRRTVQIQIQNLSTTTPTPKPDEQPTQPSSTPDKEASPN
jgi:hypothetical protein